MLIPTNPATVAQTDALTAAYTELHPEVTFEIEQRPGGAEGDNMIKTRLATGEMADIFQYNSGSLFQALRPTQTLTDLSGLAAAANIADVYKPVVTADGKIYGVPYEAAMGGGIFYNTKIFDELGLEVPKTWEEFMANNEKIKAAGKVPIAQTYRDTWTSQLFVLADFYNVLAEVPTFADDYTANKVKYAKIHASRIALRHFSGTQEPFTNQPSPGLSSCRWSGGCDHGTVGQSCAGVLSRPYSRLNHSGLQLHLAQAVRLADCGGYVRGHLRNHPHRRARLALLGPRDCCRLSRVVGPGCRDRCAHLGAAEATPCRASSHGTGMKNPKHPNDLQRSRGYAAGRAGINKDDNPYPIGSPQAHAWSFGWKVGRLSPLCVVREKGREPCE